MNINMKLRRLPNIFRFMTIFAILMMNGGGVIPAGTVHAQSTLYKINTESGGDCNLFGSWDDAIRTCNLTGNVEGMIEIEISNITLEGNGHTLTGPGTNYQDTALLVNGPMNVRVQNLTIQNAYYGISLYGAQQSVVSDVMINGSVDTGIYVMYSGNNMISNNTLTNTTRHAIQLYYSSGGNIITGNIISGSEQGIFIQESADNIISNNNVSNNHAGVYLSHTTGNTIIDNIVSDNAGMGIYAYDSAGTTISGNQVANSGEGIRLDRSGASTLRNNILSGNQTNFYLMGESDADYINDIDTSNLADGKSIYYLVGATDQTFDSSSNAATFYCINCINVTVRDVTLTGNAGVVFWNTHESRIENVTSSNNSFHGIYLGHSEQITITGSNISSVYPYGIYLASSVNNTIQNNYVYNYPDTVYLKASSGNTLEGNTFEGGDLRFDDSTDNLTYHNNIVYSTAIVSGGSGNLFSQPAPTGGNYWSSFDDTGEGCLDLNANGSCDAPYIFSGGQDDLPWARPTGWINHAPVADAGGPYTAIVNQPIILDASASFDPDDHALAYHWDLDNDGEYDDLGGPTPTTAFSQTGEFTIGLHVYDVFGLTSTATATVTVTEQAPNPSFSVHLKENQVHGYGWPLDANVTLTIDGNEIGTGTVTPANWDPNQTVVGFDLGESLTLQAGQLVEMTDGNITKSHIVTDLVVDGVDLEHDTVFGTASADTQVDIGHIYCDENGCFGYRREIADSNGEWLADFSIAGEDADEQDIIDIKPGMGSEVRQCDQDGDCTQYKWWIANPIIVAFLDGDWLGGDDWPRELAVTATIDDPGNGSGVDFTDTQLPGDRPWAPNGTWIDFDLQGFDLKPGALVTYDNGQITKTHIVIDLTVTSIDGENDTLSGVAAPDTEIHAWVDAPFGSVNRNTFADENGDWFLDFSIPGSGGDEQQTVEITPGTTGQITAFDTDWDKTQIGWRAPDPRIFALLGEQRVHAWGWPAGTPLTLKIDNPATTQFPDYTGIQVATAFEDWDHGAEWGIAYEIQPGYLVTVSGGGITKELDVAHLTVTTVDVDADTVSGTGDPGYEIHVGRLCDDNSCTRRNIYVDADGNWFADFSVPGADEDETVFDIRPGSGTGVYQIDEDNDATNVGWDVPNPTVGVRANENRVEGWGWTLGSTVTVTVDDPGTVITPDISKTALVYEASWNPGEYCFDVNLGNEYDIKPGDIVTASDDGITKTHTVTSLVFTEIDIDMDTVTGLAEPGSPVDLWTCDNSNCYNIPTVATNDNGVWAADFTGTYDLVRGSWVDSSQNDEDGDATFYGENVPNPSISVRANENRIEGQQWTLDSTITVTLDDLTTEISPDITKTAVVYEAPWNPGEYRFDVNLNSEYDIKPGDIVTASDGIITKSHTVTSLAFTEIDIDNDTVTGEAEAGSRLDIWTCDDFGCYNIPTVVANSNGVWVANFTNVYDIVRGTWVDSSQYDNDGDSTMWGKTVPNPNFSVRLTDNEVHGYEWLLGTTVTLTVDDPGTPQPVDYTDSQIVIAADWDPNQTFVQFRLWDGNFALESGMTVSMSDGILTKIHEVTDVVVTAVDPALDTVSGSAQPGSQVDIGHIFCDENGCYGYRRVNADENGNWIADFAHVGEDDDEQDIVDLTFGMGNEARQCDEDGDCTVKYWNIIWVAPDTIPLVVGIGSDHDLSLPWTDIDALTILNQLFEPPFRLMDDGTFMFAAASQYSVSADGLVHTITFRDMTWSDGVPVTAQHYADGLLRLLDPASGYDYPSFYYPIAGARDYNQGLISDPNEVGIHALDAHTLQITLDSPTAYFKEFLAYPAFLPVRLDLIAQHGESWISPENFVGNGPYRLLEHDAGHFLLERNPYYYDTGQGQFDQIGFAIIPDDHERLEAYRRGDIDLLWTFPRYEYQNIINDPVLSQDIDISTQPGVQYLGLNVDRYPTDNALVRMALASAIDREYLINTVIGAYWHTEATGVIPPTLYGYQGDAVGYAYDAVQAQNYLAQAGFPAGTGFPEITLISNTGHEDIVEYIAQQWRDVLGITVRVEYFDWGEYLEMLRNCRSLPASCDYNVYRLGWVVDYTDPNNILADLFGPDSPNQFAGWDNTRYRELLELSLLELDPVQRLEYIREAERILVEDDAAILPLYFTDRLSLIKAGIEPSFGPLIAHFNLWVLTNKPPLANAGQDRTVYARDLVILDASASSDPDADPLAYEWDLNNDGQYDEANGVTVSTSFLQPAIYTVGLRVTDDGGLSSTDTVTITVLSWDVRGFYQPVDMNGVYNLVKGGSTVPIKFEIFAGTTELTDTAAVQSLTYTPTSCEANAVTDTIETLTMGNTALRYEATSGQFIYNWKTPNIPTKCFRVTVTAMDGSSLVAHFKLK